MCVWSFLGTVEFNFGVTMKKFLLCSLLGAIGLSAQAGSSSAYITCGESPEGVYNTGEAPLLHVNYGLGNAGGPGAFWLAAMAPGGNGGAVLSGENWVNYTGGLSPPYATYSSMPSSISLKLKFPGNALTTGPYVGYTIAAGSGALTGTTQGDRDIAAGKAPWLGIPANIIPRAEGTGMSEINKAQAVTISASKEIAAGLNEIGASPADRAIMAQAHSREHYMHTLVQKNMVDSGNYQILIVVGFVDCRLLPPDNPGGTQAKPGGMAQIPAGGTSQYGGRNVSR